MQWTCGGYRSNYEDARKILSGPKPLVWCLQETMLDSYVPRVSEGYTLYAESLKPDPVSGRELITWIRYDLQWREIFLHTRLEAQAFRVITNREISVCNVYVPHGHNLTYNELRSLTSQLQSLYVILWIAMLTMYSGKVRILMEEKWSLRYSEQ